MIDEHLFKSFPFPCLFLNEHNVVVGTCNGALFPAPPECLNKDMVDYYLKIEKNWSTCPNGYAVYTKKFYPTGQTRIIIFGIKVFGVSSVQGKSDSLSIKLSKQDIEKYTDTIIDQRRSCNRTIRSLLNSNIHEIRSLNSNIYNATYELKTNLEAEIKDSHPNSTLVRNIESLSEILKLRIDYLDVISNPILIKPDSEAICVYKKFDRIARSLKWSRLFEQVGSVVKVYRGSFMLPVS